MDFTTVLWIVFIVILVIAIGGHFAQKKIEKHQ